MLGQAPSFNILLNGKAKAIFNVVAILCGTFLSGIDVIVAFLFQTSLIWIAMIGTFLSRTFLIRIVTIDLGTCSLILQRDLTPQRLVMLLKLCLQSMVVA
jgi:hypothetical protein